MENLRQRLFFALWPSDAVRQEFIEPMERLKPVVSARWVKPENLHMTLAFLGEVDAERLAFAKAAADEVRARGFRLLLDRVEHWRKPQIICLSASVCPENLRTLAESLAASLRDADFILESRPFRAHLTLARKAAYLPPDFRLEHLVRWAASSFALVESRQDRSGSVYTILHSWPLG